MATISDSFGGTGVLEGHLSDQGKPWVEMSGSLSLNGSGLSTDVAGIGEYYLNDPAFGVAAPAKVDLHLSLPNVPSPDEAMDIWLYAFGNPVNSDFTDTLALNLIYRSVGHWTWEADAADVDDNFDFATGALAGPPSIISIKPTTGEFLIDDVVVAGPLGVTPVFGAASRMGIKMSFVTGVNVRATSITAGAAAAGGQNTGGGFLPINMMAIQFPPGVKIDHRELQRARPLVRGRGRR